MKKWYDEEYEFTVEVIGFLRGDHTERYCRNGEEIGDIYRCTKYGRVKFAVTKLLSALLICGTVFSLCAVVFLLVSNSLYGWECTKTSIQMLYSIVNLPNLNLGQLQWVCAGGYLLCLLATMSKSEAKRS